MQNISLSRTRFWDDKAKAATIQRTADRHQVIMPSVFVLALIASAIAASTILTRLGANP